MTHNPELGITDPYCVDAGTVRGGARTGAASACFVNRYRHDVIAQMEDFHERRCRRPSSWPFQVNLLQAGGAPIASVIPAEGATGWADTTMLHADAAHPNCAYLWMEHLLLDPKVQGDLAAWFGSGAICARCLRGQRTARREGCVTNGFDNFEKISSGRRRPAHAPTAATRAVQPVGVGLHRVMGGN